MDDSRLPLTRNIMDAEPGHRTVLVTGGSGYVGGWMIVALLQRGYRVRTTLRHLAREGAVRAAVASQIDPAGRLSCFAADLSGEQGWASAVQGCDFVLHVASPMGQGMPRGTDLVGPARDGTLRVVRAAANAGVRRVVVTSSTAATQPASTAGGGPVQTDEAGWTDPAEKGLSEYARSKMLAERAAWEFAEGASGGMTLATVLPGMILGPVIAKSVSGSVEVVSRMLQGKVPALPRIGFNLLDVRDLADLHIRAMEAPRAAGERFIAVSGFLWLADIARLLREHLGARAAKVPTRALPDLVLRLSAWFSAEAAFTAPMLGQRREFNLGKAETLLGWQPRPASQAVLDCAGSLIQQDLG